MLLEDYKAFMNLLAGTISERCFLSPLLTTTLVNLKCSTYIFIDLNAWRSNASCSGVTFMSLLPTYLVTHAYYNDGYKW